MDTDAQSKEPEGTDTEHGATDLSTAEDAQHSESQPGGPVPVSPEQVHMSLGDDVGANPQFSEAEPNPAFTEATAPPPRQAQLDSKIRELEQRLDEATRQIERGTNALERAREARR